MKKILFRNTRVVFVLVAAMAVSCTNLDEDELLYDQVSNTTFFRNDEEVLAAFGQVYTNLYGFNDNNNMFNLNEVTSDEIVVPTRGPDWGDGGHWVRLKRHTWTNQDSRIENGWNFNYAGVVHCNRLITTFEGLDNDLAKSLVPELKVVRAIYYYWLMDLYGNVPIVTGLEDQAPPTNSRQEVYDFIESEILQNMDALAKTGPADESTYGRVNYYGAQAALVKLYLNAEVYTGTPQWDKAIAACDEIINSGEYTLTDNYADNFVRDNKGVSETIWAIPYDEVYAQGWHLPMITLHPQNQLTYNMTAQPWNGFASTQEFYESFIDPSVNPGPQGTVVGTDPAGTPTTGTVDKRLSNFLVGPQYAADGVTQLLDGSAEGSDPDGQPLTFTPYINELEPNAWRQAGARIGKWEFYDGMGQFLSNDFAIFRYADVLLSKAEAIARKNNDWNDPITLSLVNQIRQKHGGVDDFVTMDADKMLAERGRELFAESHRRVDMIRFGKFTDAFQFHPTDADDHVTIFPVPLAQLQANPNLEQNDGYSSE